MMKVYKLNKQDIEEGKWSSIFQKLDNDTNMVKHFLRLTRKELKLSPHDDLDTQLSIIGNHVKSYVEFNASGIVKIL